VRSVGEYTVVGGEKMWRREKRNEPPRHQDTKGRGERKKRGVADLFLP
jgi:hypothetical protein